MCSPPRFIKNELASTSLVLQGIFFHFTNCARFVGNIVLILIKRHATSVMHSDNFIDISIHKLSSFSIFKTDSSVKNLHHQCLTSSSSSSRVLLISIENHVFHTSQSEVALIILLTFSTHTHFATPSSSFSLRRPQLLFHLVYLL